VSSRRVARIRIAVVALLGVVLVPVTALALASTPARVLPERIEARIEERLETVIALGLLGAVGTMIGIAIAVVEL
jgi:hypothetical protein